MNKTIISLLLFFVGIQVHSQGVKDSLLNDATLEQCIEYAITHQPQVQQAQLDERITEYNIRSRLADWYPQIGFNYSLQHNFQRITTVINEVAIPIGVNNTSAGQLSLTQNIFNRDLLLANRTRGDIRLQTRQNTAARKIDISVNVTKAFYDILTTRQQIKVADENIARLQKSLDDAYYRYQAGVTDKTDYKRAQISLNNTTAAKQANQSALVAKLEYLKSLMGYPVSAPIDVVYDSLKMEREAAFDTLQRLDVGRRIEYQQLATQTRLQQLNVVYEKNAFLPVLAVNAGYNLNYFNNNFGKLYGTNYPNSFAGLTTGIPIFQGGRRKSNIRAAELQVTRIGLEIANFTNAANSEYAAALAGYKGNLSAYQASRANVDLAQEVYDVIKRQYDAGIKNYLEVIISETDLRAAQINYFNALYQVLASKVDAQKALGLIVY